MKLLIIYSCFVLTLAHSCLWAAAFITDEEIQKIKIQYQENLTKLKDLGVASPEHIADLVARKFINRPDWEKALLMEQYNPKLVYQPAPITWDNWQNVDDRVTAFSQENKSLTLKHLLDWNSSALNNTVPSHIALGKIKITNNYGQNLSQRDALSNTEIENLLNIKFSQENIKLGWVDLYCKESYPASYSIEESSKECKKIFKTAKKLKNFNDFWKNTFDEMTKFDLVNGKTWFWYACWPRLKNDASLTKKCGMIVYPEMKHVENELLQIIREINEFRYPNNTKMDPATFAFTMQRRLVALHPFNKGNGRVSRWVMDYILKKFSLPFILIENMDKDLTLSPSEVSLQAKRGMEEYLHIMQSCLKQYQTGHVEAQCKTI